MGSITNQEACRSIHKMLQSLYKKGFNSNLDADLLQRKRTLWVIGIDSPTQTMIDICGSIGSAHMSHINSMAFMDCSAGYRADAHQHLSINTAEFDAFLINTNLFNAKDDVVEPIIIHELAHLREQTNIIPAPQYNDAQNADAIIASLDKDQFHPSFGHNKNWAQHLAIGARTIIQKNLTDHKSIRAYLEAAIPAISRKQEIRAVKGWP